MCLALDGSRLGLGWYGSLWFGRVRVSVEPGGSGSEVVAGRQAVLAELAVWLVDVYSVGRATVCLIGGHIESPNSMFDVKHFIFADLLQMILKCCPSHHCNVVETAVTHRMPSRPTGGTVPGLFFCGPECSHRTETGNS